MFVLPFGLRPAWLSGGNSHESDDRIARSFRGDIVEPGRTCRGKNRRAAHAGRGRTTATTATTSGCRGSCSPHDAARPDSAHPWVAYHPRHPPLSCLPWDGYLQSLRVGERRVKRDARRWSMCAASTQTSVSAQPKSRSGARPTRSSPCAPLSGKWTRFPASDSTSSSSSTKAQCTKLRATTGRMVSICRSDRIARRWSGPRRRYTSLAGCHRP